MWIIGNCPGILQRPREESQQTPIPHSDEDDDEEERGDNNVIVMDYDSSMA